MGLWHRFFGTKTETSDTAGGWKSTVTPAPQVLPRPEWSPLEPAGERLAAYGRRVARELNERNLPPSREGGNHWVISYDVAEAVWWVAESGSWAAKNGRIRDGWSQGPCLLLFTNGVLGQGTWFGEVDPTGASVGIDDVGPLTLPSRRWAAGNLGRWRPGPGGLNPKAREHFKGFWPEPRQPFSPWAGTSAQLKHFLAEGRSQIPRSYY